MFLQIVEIIFLLVGAGTSSALLVVFVGVACTKFKEIMHRQSKIRCLCKHEYTKDYTFTMGPCTDYHLVCRKCGKKVKIVIHDDEV